jgi:hypothetical protein
MVHKDGEIETKVFQAMLLLRELEEQNASAGENLYVRVTPQSDCRQLKCSRKRERNSEPAPSTVSGEHGVHTGTVAGKSSDETRFDRRCRPARDCAVPTNLILEDCCEVSDDVDDAGDQAVLDLIVT